MNRKKSICTIVLVAANVIIFLLLTFRGMTEDANFMLAHGAMYVPDILYKGKYYELLTSMFLHFGFQHLMNNMVSLSLLGYQLEQEVGKLRFLVIYLFSGLAGNLLSMAVELKEGGYAVSAGASGAIFGITGALLYIAIRNRGRVGNISGRGIVFMAIVSLYLGFTSTGVDNFAHIGGFVCGFILAVILYRKRERQEERW